MPAVNFRKTFDYSSNVVSACFGLLALNAIYEDLPSLVWLPDVARLNMGVMEYWFKVPWAEGLIRSYSGLYIFKLTTVALLIMAAARVMPILPLATIAALLFGGMLRSYSHLFHSFLLPLQLALVFSLLYICRVKLSRRREFIILAVAISHCYFAAGLSKLLNTGLDWWHGENLRPIVLTNSLNRMQFDFGLQEFWLGLPVWAFGIMGLFGLVIELVFPVILFFGRKTSFVVPLLAIGMHIGILLSQGILFLDLIALNALLLCRSFDDSLRFPLLNFRALFVGSRRIALTLLVAGALVIPIVYRIEFFPITAWQMYSYRFPADSVVIWRMNKNLSDGTSAAFSPDQYLGALTDCRYRDYFFLGPEATTVLLRSTLSSMKANPPADWNRLQSLAVVAEFLPITEGGRAETVELSTVAKD